MDVGVVLHGVVIVVVDFMAVKVVNSYRSVFGSLTIGPGRSSIGSFCAALRGYGGKVLNVCKCVSAPHGLKTYKFNLVLAHDSRKYSMTSCKMPNTCGRRFAPSCCSLIRPFRLVCATTSRTGRVVRDLARVRFDGGRLRSTCLKRTCFLHTFARFFLFVGCEGVPLVGRLPGTPGRCGPRTAPRRT